MSRAEGEGQAQEKWEDGEGKPKEHDCGKRYDDCEILWTLHQPEKTLVQAAEKLQKPG
jgi:hypothetical protein